MSREWRRTASPMAQSHSCIKCEVQVAAARAGRAAGPRPSHRGVGRSRVRRSDSYFGGTQGRMGETLVGGSNN